MSDHDPMACAIKHMVDMMSRSKAKKYLGEEEAEGESPHGDPEPSEANKKYPESMAMDHDNESEDVQKEGGMAPKRHGLFALIGKMKKR